MLVVFIWGVAGAGILFAQNELQRISVTERSDGNGYVIRYHLTRMANSYDLRQPEDNRIQMQLFSPGLNTAGIQLPEMNDEIVDINIVPIEGGIGIDITTAGNVFFEAETYPDQNMRDLLLALEYSNRSEISEIISQSEPYEWSMSTTDEEMSMQQVSEDVVDDESASDMGENEVSNIQRREPKVHFGIVGGIGVSNKIGGYSSDPRQGLTMGLIAAIDLPYSLSSFETGIETGVFYTQKGFKNPSRRINAQTVVLDYLEVPVMGKLSYHYSNIIEPYAVAGGYLGFRTAAETIQDDGDREDLDEVTKSMDFGFIGGIGSDFNFNTATVSLQLRYEVGLPRWFDEGFSGRERPGYLALLLGFRF